MCNCLVMITEYRSSVHAIIFMGGAAASETLIEGYICTIGRCSTPPKQPRENTGRNVLHFKYCCSRINYSLICSVAMSLYDIHHSCLEFSLWQLQVTVSRLYYCKLTQCNTTFLQVFALCYLWQDWHGRGWKEQGLCLEEHKA